MKTQAEKPSVLLKIGIPVLALSLAALAYQSYKSIWLPYSGYGDESMAYLQKELPASLSAGDLTHFHSGGMAFEQEAPNLSWGLSAAFDRGDGIFEKGFSPSLADFGRYDVDRDGVGPVYNDTSCEACHAGDGRAQPPADETEMIKGGFIRVSIPGTGPYGEPLSPKGYGAQISDRSIGSSVPPEATTRIRWIEQTGSFPDGEAYSLRRPKFIIKDLAYGPMPDNAIFELRLAPHVNGLGLLEAIPEKTILEWADPNDKDGDGISGRPNYVWDLERGGKIMGRFSWKANAFDVRQQAATAAYNDMGVNNPLFFYRHDDHNMRFKSRQNCEPTQGPCIAAFSSRDFEMTPAQLLDVTTYLQLLGVVYRRNVDKPEVQQGEKLFSSIGCTGCHKPEVVTGEHEISRLEGQRIHPYTDLLLHDMGKGLSGRRDYEATEQEWRTTPLWGIGVTKAVNGHTNFLHDGRARNIQEAILWHGGEAEAAKQAYMGLPKQQRSALLEFVNNL